VIGVGHGVNWNGNNWAFRCDWDGGDIGNAQIPGEECGGRCAITPTCTHFTWTTSNGGTCWMKNLQVSKSDARDTSDSSMVCGYMVFFMTVSTGSMPNPTPKLDCPSGYTFSRILKACI